jgi:hypothetical protein
MFIDRIFRIFAPLTHTRPNVLFGGSRKSMLINVRDMLASAAMRLSRRYRSSLKLLPYPALTQKYPATPFNLLDSFQPIILEANNHARFRHIRTVI